MCSHWIFIDSGNGKGSISSSSKNRIQSSDPALFTTRNNTRVIAQRGGLAVLPCSVKWNPTATVSKHNDDDDDDFLFRSFFLLCRTSIILLFPCTLPWQIPAFTSHTIVHFYSLVEHSETPFVDFSLAWQIFCAFTLLLCPSFFVCYRFLRKINQYVQFQCILLSYHSFQHPKNVCSNLTKAEAIRLHYVCTVNITLCIQFHIYSNTISHILSECHWIRTLRPQTTEIKNNSSIIHNLLDDWQALLTSKWVLLVLTW